MKIRDLKVPSTYILDRKNAADPSPIHMDCLYDLRPDESGFVLKWLLDGNPVYQWIPPKRPQAIAFFKTRADPTVEMEGDSLQRYRSLNIIRPEFNMTGEFTCSVQTFQSSDSRSAKLQIIGECVGGCVKERRDSNSKDFLRLQFLTEISSSVTSVATRAT